MYYTKEITEWKIILAISSILYKTKELSNRSIFISLTVVKIHVKKQLCEYNWYVYIPFHDKFIFWSDDDGDCVKILLHEADVLHFWNDRHRPNVAPEDGESIKHRKSKVILFCPWLIQIAGSFYLI